LKDVTIGKDAVIGAGAGVTRDIRSGEKVRECDGADHRIRHFNQQRSACMRSLGVKFDFCPVLAELLETRKSVGRTGRVYEGLDALSTINNLCTIRELMRLGGALRTLEVGLSFGGSALVFCASHKELGHPPEAQHTALDPFQTTVWDSCGLMALERAGLIGYMDFRQTCSALELPRLVKDGAQFDLVYVDGSHLFEDVFVDAYFVTRLLSAGGVVAFDDSVNPHIAKVLRFLRTNIPRSALEELDLGSYMKKRDRFTYRVARYLRKTQLTAFRRIGPMERAWDAPFRSF
jgi:cephalosporin hydroxylase